MNERKPVKCGEDFVRDASWNPRVATREGVVRLGRRIMDSESRRLGFKPCVFDAGDYFRLNFGRSK